MSSVKRQLRVGAKALGVLGVAFASSACGGASGSSNDDGDESKAGGTSNGGSGSSGGSVAACKDPQWTSESTTPSDAARGCDSSNWMSFGDDLRGCSMEGVEIFPSGSDFAGVKAYDLKSCPTWPSGLEPFEGSWICVEQPENGRSAVLDTGVDLREANLGGANLEHAHAPAADLRGTNLSKANLSGAELSGAITYDLPACPEALPGADWYCLDQPAVCGKLLIGPGADLRAADLGEVELPEAAVPQEGNEWYLSDVRATDLSTCPSVWPEAACCVEQPASGDSALLAPGMSLARANLVGADLAECDLSFVVTAELKAFDLIHCPEASVGRCVEQGDGEGYALLAEAVDVSGVNLAGADAHDLELYGAQMIGSDLSGADLQGAILHSADLSDADLSGALLGGVSAMYLHGCPAGLPEPWLCVGQPLAVSCPGEMFGPEGLPLPETACRFALVGPGASLRGVELRFADLSGADLTGADLGGANLEGANFEGAVLDGVIWDSATCPDGTSADANGGTCEGHLQLPL